MSHNSFSVKIVSMIREVLKTTRLLNFTEIEDIYKSDISLSTKNSLEERQSGLKIAIIVDLIASESEYIKIESIIPRNISHNKNIFVIGFDLKYHPL